MTKPFSQGTSHLNALSANLDFEPQAIALSQRIMDGLDVAGVRWIPCVDGCTTRLPPLAQHFRDIKSAVTGNDASFMHHKLFLPATCLLNLDFGEGLACYQSCRFVISFIFCVLRANHTIPIE